MSLLGVGVGSLAALATLGFTSIIFKIDRLYLNGFQSSQEFSFVLWLPIFLGLAGAGLLVALIRRWAAPGNLQGIAHSIAASHGLEGHMPISNGIKSVLASLVSLCGGASVGQYGPVGHLGSLIGLMLAKLSRSDHSRRSVSIACGVAAAIAAVFHAPIAGVVFAHEVILRHYSLRAFAPVTVASSIGYLLARFFTDQQPLFIVPGIAKALLIDYIWFAAIGVSGGLIAVLMMRSIGVFEGLAKQFSIPDWVRPALAGAILALVAIMIPEVLGTGIGTLKSTLSGHFESHYLLVILIGKLFATALCIGLGFVGGVFSPALLVGVVFGTLFAQGYIAFFPTEITSVLMYAACGMVAVVSPVIGAPLSAILLVFELTGNYTITTAVMVSAVFSNLVSYRVFGRSYYDHQLSQAGCDMTFGRERLLLNDITVGCLVDSSARVVDGDMKVSKVIEIMRQNRWLHLLVTDTKRAYLGTFAVEQLVFMESVDGNTRVLELADKAILPINESALLGDVLESISGQSVSVYAVVNSYGMVVGSVTSEVLARNGRSVSNRAAQEISDHD